ncbi:GH3 domain-containing protein-like [Acanthaster planci]|uniref:GH3 domain-containing protein-like n=1 Tax=Acanthaster planci TaxID=133434 RepID=A0A8B7Y327_ACAPL|nr:GH3 domain-containing protein-like [Acanthaster planci]
MSVLGTVAKGFGAVAVVSTVLVAHDIYHQRRSKLHTLDSLVRQYIINKLIGLIGNRMRNRLESDTRNCRAVQEEILLARIKAASGLAYGQEFQFADVADRDDFCRKHPLMKYDDIKPYIERVAAGEDRILTPDRPIILGVTSGTSGKSSIIPMTKGQSLAFFTQGISVLYNAMYDAYPQTNNLQKILKFFYTPKSRVSSGGIPVGPNSSSPKSTKGLLPLYTTPLAGYDITTEPEALYVHLLFGLMDRNLGMIEANFASLVHTAFVELERKWPSLVQDIEHGHVSRSLQIDEDVRQRLDQLIKPDPERAAELRKEFEKGFDGIAKRIWPHLHIVAAVDSGPFQMYGKLLDERYTTDIPTYSALYAATEGLIGVNIWPKRSKRQYLLAPRSMFYEFIPVDKIFEDQPQTLFIDQVTKGSTYELVITNAGGLYRFRLGDVVKVVDFYNECPVVELKYRKGQYLNVRGEKTSEDILYKALTDTVDGWEGVSLVDYSCAESPLLEKQDASDNSFPHYIVFVELSNEKDAKAPVHLDEKQKLQLDENLRQQSFVYNSFREKGSIAPAVVHIVRRGSFKRLKRFSLKTRSVSVNQFKVPRVMRRPEAAQFLFNNVE